MTSSIFFLAVSAASEAAVFTVSAASLTFFSILAPCFSPASRTALASFSILAGASLEASLEQLAKEITNPAKTANLVIFMRFTLAFSPCAHNEEFTQLL